MRDQAPGILFVIGFGNLLLEPMYFSHLQQTPVYYWLLFQTLMVFLWAYHEKDR